MTDTNDLLNAHFEEQNAMSVCKNCGLDKEIIDAALAETYRNGETAGLAGKEETK